MKRILVLTVWLLIAPLAMAETSQTSRTKRSTNQIAPSLGFTAFSLKAPGYEVGTRGGFSAGANMYLSSGAENLDYEVGAHYFEAGGKQGNLFITNELMFGYLAIPLGIRWSFYRSQENAQNFAYLKGGLMPSLLLSAKQKVTDQFNDLSIEEDIKSDTNGFDLLAYVGIGGNYDLGGDHGILYELVYTQGTQKVLKDIESKNQGYMASVMYSIGM